MSDGLKLLGCIIDTGSVHLIRELPAELFLPDELPAYDMIRMHYRRYGEIPAIATVEEELAIVLPPAPEVPDYYIKRVHDRRLYSMLREHFNTLKENLREYDMDAARDVIDEMRLATRVIHTDSDIRNLQEAGDAVMSLYRHAHENPGLSGVPTGWAYYDYIVGGYQPGDLITWVARPEMGKTTLLLQQAGAAWNHNFSVLLVTMEMTIEQIARRLAAMQAGINPQYIRKGTLSSYALRRMEEYLDNMRGAERFRIFSGGLKKKTSDVELLVREYSPDIVFIDGVYMMQSESKRAQSGAEKVSSIFDELKRMALSCNIPACVTTQFNRTAGKKGKEGSLENIAYSDAISTHSSIIVAVLEGKPPNMKTERVAEIIKGREGEAGKFDIHYKFSPTNFGEVERLPEAGGEGDNGEGVLAPVAVQADVDWMG